MTKDLKHLAHLFFHATNLFTKEIDKCVSEPNHFQRMKLLYAQIQKVDIVLRALLAVKKAMQTEYELAVTAHEQELANEGFLEVLTTVNMPEINTSQKGEA